MQHAPMISRLWILAQRFFRAKPVVHITAAILAIGFLPLFPPLISEILFSSYFKPDEAAIAPNDIDSSEAFDYSNAQPTCAAINPPCALEVEADSVSSESSLGSNQNCAESLLALGHKLDLQHVTKADLELIPGISAKLSAAIIRDRKSLLKEAKGLHSAERYQALQQVNGIGEAISLRLDELIDLAPVQLDSDAVLQK